MINSSIGNVKSRTDSNTSFEVISDKSNNSLNVTCKLLFCILANTSGMMASKRLSVIISRTAYTAFNAGSVTKNLAKLICKVFSAEILVIPKVFCKISARYGYALDIFSPSPGKETSHASSI